MRVIGNASVAAAAQPSLLAHRRIVTSAPAREHAFAGTNGGGPSPRGRDPHHGGMS